jgi:hypothetical protein
VHTEGFVKLAPVSSNAPKVLVGQEAPNPELPESAAKLELQHEQPVSTSKPGWLNWQPPGSNRPVVTKSTPASNAAKAFFDPDATKFSAAGVERVLRDYPKLEQRVVEMLSAVDRSLQHAQTLELAPATTDGARRVLEHAKQAFGRGDMASAAQHLALLDGKLEPLAASDAGIARAKSALRTRLVSAVSNVLEVPPPAVLAKGEALLASHAQQSQVLLDSVTSDSHVHFSKDDVASVLNGFGAKEAGERLTSHDAAKALLRLNASLWSVQRDLRNGTLSAQDFGKPEWAGVDGKAMSDLAMKRLRNDSVDFDAEMKGMLRDPVWSKNPLTVQDETTGHSEPLTPENAGNWMKESITSVVTPNRAAEYLGGLDVMQGIRADAIKVANAPVDQQAAAMVSAKLNAAYSIFKGGDLAPNASQSFTVAASVAGVSLTATKAAPKGASSSELDRQVKDGEILGNFQKDGTTYTVTARTIPDIAREIRGKMSTGVLADLDPKARAALNEMTGPAKAPGALMASRTDNEASDRNWRRTVGELVTTGAIGVASMGVGTIAEGALYGLLKTAAPALEASSTLLSGTRLAASSATYTTMSKAGQDLSATDYLVDMGMMGVLGAGAKFAGLAGKLVPGSGLGAQLGRGAVTQTAAVTTAASLTTGLGALDQTARGNSPTWKQLKESFGHNLAVVGTLHGVNLGLARIAPQLGAGTQQRADFEALRSRVHDANAKVSTTLERISDVLSKAGTVPEARRAGLAEYQETLMKKLDAHRAEADGLRTELLGFTRRYLPGQTNEVLKDFGKANPDAVNAEATPLQRQLEQTVIERFVDVGRSLGVGANETPLMEPGVKGVSSGVLSSFLDVVKSPHASDTPDNIKHLGSVFQDALRATAKAKGAPLNQREVDQLAQETVLTDVWFKTFNAGALRNAPTAPTNYGNTGGEIHDQMKAQAKANVLKGANVSPEVAAEVGQWIDRGAVPMAPNVVAETLEKSARATAAARGLGPEATEALAQKMVKEGTQLWGEKIMGTGEWANANGFMLGTWIHGIPAFNLVKNTIHAAPHTGLSAQQAYEAVLGHHMAGFIAGGFGRARLSVDFESMEAMGQLPPGASQRLGRLYDSSTTLAAKWRPIIDRGMNDLQRAQYYQDAAPMREAVAGMAPRVRQQLLSDDAGQFTSYEAMGKWFGMQNSAKTMADSIASVTKAAQGYGEEARARDSNPNVAERGSDFYSVTGQTMARVGVTVDPVTGSLRPAVPGEKAHQQLANGLAKDAALRAQFLAAHPEAASLLGKGQPSAAAALQLVDWFRGAAVDKDALTRLTSGPG